MEKDQVLGDLCREVGRIAGGAGAWQDITKPADHRAFTPAPRDVRLRETGRTKEPDERGPFGRWLLMQVDRDGIIGQLAAAGRADRSFPRNGDPEAVRKRLSEQGADPDMHEALDDAELDWKAY
ncbi:MULTISPECIES: hypothetical protein [unclassified Novosphingobium]|uniref:hypothetical protein n=1 Tax=unclassified Novosphingobium TaxID=2644732 RepID=UPI001358EF79|nr:MULTISPECIES: hypothetical protein [unclassified Novosphingobium]